MEQIFEKINELFDKYLKTLNLENTENAKLSIEQKITLAVWDSNKNYREFSVEVVETVREALKYFPNSEAFKNGAPFSKYLFFSLGNSISTSEEKAKLADRNGWQYISDDKYRRVKRVKKVFDDIRKMYPDQDLKDSFIIEKAEEILDMDEDEIWECLKMSKAATKGDEASNENGETFSIFDTLWDGIEKDPMESELIKQEMLEVAFPKILEDWNAIKKEDVAAMLSELLTVKLLEFGFDIDELAGYAFINKEICEIHSENPQSELLEFQKIAEKYGLTKSAASQRLSRFLKNS